MMYFEDYIDGAEALPHDLQRAISILKEAEAVSFKTSQKLYEKVESFLADFNGNASGSTNGKDKEKMFLELNSLFTKSLNQADLLRSAVIAMDKSVERRMKKMTSDLEKIEELFLEPEVEEEVEAPAEPPPNAYLQQFQQKAANNSRKSIYGKSQNPTASSTPAPSAKPYHHNQLTSSTAPSQAPTPQPNSQNTQTQLQSGVQAGHQGASKPTPQLTPGPIVTKKRKDLGDPAPSQSQSPIGQMKKLKTSQPELSSNLPVFNGRGPPPPLCGPTPAAPDYTLKKGDAVAARITKPRDPNPEWILATVVRHYAGRNRYEVEDVEEEEVPDGKSGYVGRKKYLLSADAIIPLPTTLPDPSKKLEFPVEKKVLALYPGTTCFYEATVVHPPSKRKKENDYLVQFEDDEESESPMKAIPQMFVLNMPADSHSGSPV